MQALPRGVLVLATLLVMATMLGMAGAGVARASPATHGVQAASPTAPPASLAPGPNSVSAFGSAASLGPANPLHTNRPLAGMAGRPDGSGYWLVAADGGIFNYGSAPFLGSMGATPLTSPVVGMAATPDGGGYWLVGADGGIFNFGDAAFLGSMAATALNSPVVGMAATPDGGGYWLVAADGGIFNFGSAPFLGSAASASISAPIVGIAAASNGNGYWLASSSGEVYPFGVSRLGDATAVAGSPAIAGIAPAGSSGYWLLEGHATANFSMQPGPGLAAVQQALQDLGYWDGGPTGSMNDATQQAVWAFQKYQNLPLTGSLDAAGLHRLGIASRPHAAKSRGNLVEVDKGRNLVFIVEGGYTTWVFNSSTGGGYTYTSQGVTSVAITPVGTFHVAYGIDGWHTSPLGQMWRPRFFVDGYALHGDTEVPPNPVSHGCVRVSIEAMNFLWDGNLVPIGEELMVHG